MMLTIHGLPVLVKYHELKALIQQKCNISDFILDNLTADLDGSKKVRIGLAGEGEGAHLSKCLDGFRMGSNILRVMPVGKPPINQHQSNFDVRGGFMTNQPGNFGNQPSNYSNQPGSFSNQQNHPGLWTSAAQSNQWVPNQQPHGQVQQHSFEYQQRTNQQFSPKQQPGPAALYSQPGAFNQSRPVPEQGFEFTPKPSVPPQPVPQRRHERSNFLRSVEIIKGPPASNRYPEQSNPATINKNLFQGASQFDGQQGYPAPGPTEHVPWNKPTPQQKPSSFSKPDIPTFEKRETPKDFDKARPGHHAAPERRLSPHARRDSPHAAGIPHGRAPERRISPGRRVSPPGRRISPGRRVSPPGRRIPPTRRKASPGRRISPTGRRSSPGRRISPTGRRASPGRRASSPGRRVSPTGRRISPPGRRLSPSDRRSRKSPGRGSPHKRLSSPPRGGRYSPRRHDKAEFDARSKPARPAYEPDAKAPNQAIYSGGYRPIEKTPYPSHQADQRGAPWQDRDKNVYPGTKKQDDDRRMMRGGESDAKRSPTRKSRSPSRRDGRERSPLKDRYRRHSPSPRSPRRSWALEKRRSTEISDAPPPPVWPGQNQEEHYGGSTSKPEPTKPTPAWNQRSYEDTEEELRRENRSHNEEQMRMRRDAGPRDMNAPVSRKENSPRHHGFKPPEERINRDSKFEPRDSKFGTHDTKIGTHDTKFGTHDPKFGTHDSKFARHDPKFAKHDPKFATRDPKFGTHDSKFARDDPNFATRDPKFATRDPKFATHDPKFATHDPKFARDDPNFATRDPKFATHDPKFATHDPKFATHDPKFATRDPAFEPHDTKFEPRGPKLDSRDHKFATRDPAFEPHDTKFEPRGPKLESRDHKFEPRDPKFDIREPKFEPRVTRFEQHSSRFEQREPAFVPRVPKFDPREPKFDSREAKFDSREPRFDSREPRFDSREPKFDSREPKFDSREPKFDSREPKFDSHEPKFDSREPKFDSREPKFDSRERKLNSRERKFDSSAHKFDSSAPKFDPHDRKIEQLRDTKFDSREPKFQPQMSRIAPYGPTLEPRGPTFEARDLNFEQRDTKPDNRGPRFEPRGPNFEPRLNEFASGFQPNVPTFHPQDTDFESHDPKFGPRTSTYEQHEFKLKPSFELLEPKFQQHEPTFEPRESKFETRDPKFQPRAHQYERDNFRDHNPRRVDDMSERTNYQEKDKFLDYQRSEPHRADFQRDERKDIRKPSAHEITDRNFENNYQRPEDFVQNVEQLKCADRSEDREDYSRDSRRRVAGDDRHETANSDRRPRGDYYNMETERRNQDSRPDSRPSGENTKQRDCQAERNPRQLPPKKYLSLEVKAKRKKAIEEISSQLIKKYGNFEMDEEIKDRVCDELKVTLGKILVNLFGNKYVECKEMVVRFNSKYRAKDGLKIFEDVMACFPKQHRVMMKRFAQQAQDLDRREIPAKGSAPGSNLKEEPRVKANVRPLKKLVPVKRPVAKAVAAPKRKAPPTATAPPSKRAAPAPAPAADGHHELDAAAARELEAELQRIMIEVWQQLPNEASTDEDNAALEIMRNEVSDDLKNALGLNVTKRLLNIFNPLNVKVHFSTKPERKFLSHFLKRYNFVAFKRIVKVENTFAAQVRTIADYDDLCSNKKIFCGTAKLTITPCYRFTLCPNNITTVYSNELFEKKSEDSEINEPVSEEVLINKENVQGNDDLEKEIEAPQSNKVVEKKLEQNVTTSVVKIANTATQTIEDDTQTTTTTKIETDSTTKNTADVFKTPTKFVAPKSETVKNSNAAVQSKIDTSVTKSTVSSQVEKSTETKETDNKNADVPVAKTTAIAEKSTQVADNNNPTNVANSKPTDLPIVQATVIPVSNKAPPITTVDKVTPNKAKSQTTVTANKAPANDKQTTVASDKTNETKVTANKALPDTTEVTPNKTPLTKATTTAANALPAQDIAKTAATTKPTPKITKTTNKPAQDKANTTASSKPTPKKAVTNVKKQTNDNNPPKDDDFEELDDHDLYLYLMSAGIVLDECSGSEDE